MSAEHTLQNSSHVGRYRIEQVLGVGSHATVYKAFDTILNRIVALKVLKPEIAADKEMFARFEREARAAANLMHPHIAWVWDIGQADGKHFLAVKYIEGPSLDKVIAHKGKLSNAEALRILEEISLALDFAHSRGVIHRDVKPRNILISQQEGAVLTDFGLAKVLYDTAVMTRVGMVLGSPGYIPPEIWSGDPASPATDQYALACVYYEMLCGRLLFGATGNFNTIIREHLEGFPLSKPWPKEIPISADQPLRKALSIKPENRYENLAAFLADLKDTTPKVVKTPDIQEFPPAIPLSSPPKETKALENITPQEGVPLQELPKGKSEQAVKGSWGTRLRSLFSHTKTKFILRCLSQPGKIYVLEGDRFIIGRDPKCDIYTDGMGISRQHAQLSRTKDGFSIKDLDSKNGTYVNGQKTTGVRPLFTGDVIDLGSSGRFVYTKE